ncbi:putative FAD-dependent oxygenase [Xylaria digitata]|nr:putative FAD-dependent oxygenase [Xylaria digitata]
MRRFGVTLLSACALGAASRNSFPADCGSPEEFSQGLRNSLSSAAAIYLPGSEEFEEVTTRWSQFDIPTVNVAVVPATEDDVAKTVRRANDCGLPVLAFNGIHGAITTLGRMDRGVAIHLRQLSSVIVAQDGGTATIGGGALSKAVTDALWASGKQTVTGTCECVSYLGPALGGGHGWLQGHHGLVADQFVSINIVLADGTLKTIDSSSDLWWAIKGAGHNFGIVTSVTAKVYDIEHRDWAIETLTFSGDKVEAVYEATNRYLSNLPAGLINWSWWLNAADVDPDRPIILFFIIQEGVATVDPAYVNPFRNIGPISSETQSGSYRDLATWTMIAVDSAPCQIAGNANVRFPIYVREYNVTALREAYDIFAANVGGANSPFSGSTFLFEGYPQQGVQSIDGDSTAFAFRDDSLLFAARLGYKPAGKELDDQAARLGNQLRDIIYRGSGREELHVYVNYAYGNEKPEGWYGYEKWRQARLKELKHKYDPEGHFSFYAPIE